MLLLTSPRLEHAAPNEAWDVVPRLAIDMALLTELAPEAVIAIGARRSRRFFSRLVVGGRSARGTLVGTDIEAA